MSLTISYTELAKQGFVLGLSLYGAFTVFSLAGRLTNKIYNRVFHSTVTLEQVDHTCPCDNPANCGDCRDQADCPCPK